MREERVFDMVKQGRWSGSAGAWWIALMLLVVAAWTPPARAQSTISANAAFEREACYLGDQIRLVISVENAATVDAPDLSGVPGATFAFAGTGNETLVFRTDELRDATEDVLDDGGIRSDRSDDL